LIFSSSRRCAASLCGRLLQWVRLFDRYEYLLIS
jgi:hypothetical protein